MIASYADDDTARLAAGIRVKKFAAIAQRARRKLAIIEAAVSLNDLAVPPGNRLEALHGDREGQHSIRINDQYRICFRWENANAHNVQITDYHS